MRILPVKISEAKDSSEVFFVELYNIKLKSGELRLSATDIDINFAGKDYLALPIERGDYRQSVDSKLDNVDIRIGNVDQAMTLALFQGLDFRGADISIIRIMYPESTQTGNETLFAPVVAGYIDSPYMSNTEFKCTVKAKSPNSECPNRRFQLNCNAVFADPEECGVGKIIRSGVVSSGSTQAKITSPERLETDRFWLDSLVTIGYESRKVRLHQRGVLYLDYPFNLDITGKTFMVEQGCNKTFQRCKEYGNGRNFSGFPSIPFELVIKT